MIDPAEVEATARNARGWTNEGRPWAASDLWDEYEEDDELEGTPDGVWQSCDPCGKLERKARMAHGSACGIETTQCRECGDKAWRQFR